MTNPNAKTLQNFLPTGEPRGVRIAELTTRIVQAVLIPRSELTPAKLRPELDHLAAYFLFGESEEAAKPIVYVGQTEDVRKRLDYHNSTKDFWRTAILVISKTHSFTQAHIRYLEWFCIKKAKEVGRFALDNDQIPGKPFVPEPMEADILDAFDTLGTLISALGYPVFEPIVKTVKAEQFFLRGKDAEAVGELVEDVFVVRAGAIARTEIVPSAMETVSAMRKRLLDGGVVIEENGHLRFTQDYLFNTPSGAAAAVLGRTSNGWVRVVTIIDALPFEIIDGLAVISAAAKVPVASSLIWLFAGGLFAGRWWCITSDESRARPEPDCDTGRWRPGAAGAW